MRRLVKIQPRYYTLKFKIGTYLKQFRRIYAGIAKAFKRCAHRSVTTDFSKKSAFISGILAAFELGSVCTFNLRIVFFQRLVNAVKRAVLCDKSDCRLLPYSRHSGNIIRCVSHERLDVNKLSRGDTAVKFCDFFCVNDACFLC